MKKKKKICFISDAFVSPRLVQVAPRVVHSILHSVRQRPPEVRWLQHPVLVDVNFALLFVQPVDLCEERRVALFFEGLVLLEHGVAAEVVALLVRAGARAANTVPCHVQLQRGTLM